MDREYQVVSPSPTTVGVSTMSCSPLLPDMDPSLDRPGVPSLSRDIFRWLELRRPHCRL